MNRDLFLELLPSTQAKFLLTKGTHIKSVDRDGKLVALYSLGKRFYKMTFHGHYYNKIVDIDEITLENARHSYFFKKGQ